LRFLVARKALAAWALSAGDNSGSFGSLLLKGAENVTLRRCVIFNYGGIAVRGARGSKLGGLGQNLDPSEGLILEQCMVIAGGSGDSANDKIWSGGNEGSTVLTGVSCKDSTFIGPYDEATSPPLSVWAVDDSANDNRYGATGVTRGLDLNSVPSRLERRMQKTY